MGVPACFFLWRCENGWLLIHKSVWFVNEYLPLLRLFRWFSNFVRQYCIAWKSLLVSLHSTESCKPGIFFFFFLRVGPFLVKRLHFSVFSPSDPHCALERGKYGPWRPVEHACGLSSSNHSPFPLSPLWGLSPIPIQLPFPPLRSGSG